MTILEIEERAGLPRANVRFYEREGFLSPARGENGYRDYSPDDLALLKRIKLLRQLKIPLEDIRAMQAGNADLSAVLNARLREIDVEQQSLDTQRAVCLELRADGAVFNTLDAEKYIVKLRQTQGDADHHIEAEETPKANYPWRRYFARTLDLALYELIWYALAYFVFNWNIAALWLLNLIVSGAFMLLIEPPLLAMFGTTPGKSLFGIRVTSPFDERPELFVCYIRVWMVFSRGMGCLIPVHNMIRMYRSYKVCKDSGEMSWDEDACCTVRDISVIRPILYVPCVLLVAATVFLIPYAADMPMHRGDITSVQFVDNVNDYLRYHDHSWVMSSYGSLTLPDEPGTITVGLDTQELVKFDIITTDNVVTAVSLTLADANVSNSFFMNVWLHSVYYSLVGARQDFLKFHFGGDFNDVLSAAATPVSGELQGNGHIVQRCELTVSGFRISFYSDFSPNAFTYDLHFLIQETP